MQVLLLENVRFHKQEEKNDPEFAKQVSVKFMDVSAWFSLKCNAAAPYVARFQQLLPCWKVDSHFGCSTAICFWPAAAHIQFHSSMFCSLKLYFP